jgi:valyl-tRNA synthetase
LKLLHPIIPFLTEELWHGMGYATDAKTIQFESWPKALDTDELAAWGIKRRSVDYVEAKQDLVRSARLLKADYNLAAKRVAFIIKPSGDKFSEMLERDTLSYISLLKAETFTIDPNYTPSNAVPSAITKLGNLYMPVDGLIDSSAEVERLSKELDKVQRGLEMVSKKLENQKFVANAPKEVVNKQKELKKELLEKSDKLTKLITTLSES